MTREIPDFIDGYGIVNQFNGIKSTNNMIEYIIKRRFERKNKRSKVVDLKTLFSQAALYDGMTISFHHHLRNGDQVVNLVMSELAKTGVRDITIAASGIFPVHECLIDSIRTGLIKKIYTSYLNGPVAAAISQGLMDQPVVLQSHGGRARAVETGALPIDIAFIAASECDCAGNMNGKNGPSAFGVLSYACPDAAMANVVVAVTDHLVDYPANPIEISQEYVDYVLVVDRIGNPREITSGTTRITQDPRSVSIAHTAAEVIRASGFLKDGFSFQTGAGGTSLATAAFVKEKMRAEGIRGGAILGGTTRYSVELLREGYFKRILDVQCFDQEAIRSVYETPGHTGMSAGMYANPWNKGAVVNQLDVVVLGATEVDVDFNVNVITDSKGNIMGGSGGHADTAAGAGLTVVVTPLVRKGKYPCIRERVTTVTTPGETVDAVVTDFGVAVNPHRQELTKLLNENGIEVKSIEELSQAAARVTGGFSPSEGDDKITAVVEYRDGTVIDVVHKIKKKADEK